MPALVFISSPFKRLQIGRGHLGKDDDPMALELLLDKRREG
jgi:hypothetical protein